MLGNPQEALRFVHVAGTKGKGSTCAFIAFILRQAGLRTGLYTSPHLNDFRERIRILEPLVGRQRAHRAFEGMISRRALVILVERLRPCIEEFNRDSAYGPLSFFEVYTALAFVYFRKKEVDVAVLETGLGGRLDATNAADALVSVITPISYEHTQKLGNTLAQIAAEKAGIIKPLKYKSGSHQPLAIIAPQVREARRVIRDRCKKAGAVFFEVNRDITYHNKGQEFTVQGVLGTYRRLRIGLLGEHQLINATAATGAVEALGLYGINVGVLAMRKGLRDTLWPGRCEIIRRKPLVVLDGCQNVASSLALLQTVKRNFKYRRLILVFGISQDKDIRGVCRVLRELADVVILTKADNPRASLPRELLVYFRGKDIYTTETVGEAKALMAQVAHKSDLVLVCGSLFVVGEFRDEKIRPH